MKFDITITFLILTGLILDVQWLCVGMGVGGVGASDYVLAPPDVSILTQVFFVENCLAKDGQ